MQAIVIGLLLAEHPKQITFADLARALVGDEPASYADLDSVARAVSELVSYGLLDRNGDQLLPSRAALRFDELPLP